MTGHQWRRVEELFAAAAELPKEQRTAYLARACADEPDVRLEVERLLAADDEEDGCIGQAIRGVATDLEATIEQLPAGERIGSYEVRGELGHGGMGTVYLAARADDQYQKKVAIKLVRLSQDHSGLRERFRRERQILANLDHPLSLRRSALPTGTRPSAEAAGRRPSADGSCRE